MTKKVVDTGLMTTEGVLLRIKEKVTKTNGKQNKTKENEEN